jgi:hypothetical protein
MSGSLLVPPQAFANRSRSASNRTEFKQAAPDTRVFLCFILQTLLPWCGLDLSNEELKTYEPMYSLPARAGVRWTAVLANDGDRKRKYDELQPAASGTESGGVKGIKQMTRLTRCVIIN